MIKQRKPALSAVRVMGFLISFSILAISFTACSKGNSVNRGTTSTEDVGGTTDVSATDDTGTVSATPTPSPGANDFGNLFDTNLSGNEQSGQSTLTNWGYPSSQEQSCLQGGYNTQQTSCIDPSQSGLRVPYSEDTFFNATLSVYGMMQWCLETVLARYPRNDAEAPAAHDAAELAAVRCYQHMVRKMQRGLPWGNAAIGNFNHQYNTLGALLITFNVLK